jgi:drug/metabolite transporter (DMT)-like permease
VGAACFGTLGIFSSLFYDEGGSPYALLFIRFVSAGPILCLIALAWGGPFPRLGVALGGLAVGIGQFAGAYALFEGFSRAPVALVVLLFYVYPLIVAVGAGLLYGEELGPRRLTVIALGFAGIALIVGTPESLSAVGVLLGIGGGACIAAVILASRYLMVAKDLNPLWLSAFMFSSPAVGLLIAAAVQQPDLDFGSRGWIWSLGTVLVSVVIPITLFYTGIKLVGAGTAALLGNVEPLVSVVLAYVVLDESLTGLQLVGGGLIVGSVLVLSLRSSTAGQDRLAAAAAARDR